MVMSTGRTHHAVVGAGVAFVWPRRAACIVAHSRQLSSRLTLRVRHRERAFFVRKSGLPRETDEMPRGNVKGGAQTLSSRQSGETTCSEAHRHDDRRHAAALRLRPAPAPVCLLTLALNRSLLPVTRPDRLTHCTLTLACPPPSVPLRLTAGSNRRASLQRLELLAGSDAALRQA